MGFTRSQGEGGNELLEALALDIAQLLGAWAHDVVRWRDVGSGLSGGDVSFNVDANSVYTAITAHSTGSHSLLFALDLALENLAVVFHGGQVCGLHV